MALDVRGGTERWPLVELKASALVFYGAVLYGPYMRTERKL